MKIKCAYCDQKTISFFNGFKYQGNVSCPNCNTNLKLESNRAYRPLAFLNIILIVYLTIKIENGNINNFFGYIIIFSTFILTMFFTTKATISNQPLTNKEQKHIKKDNYFKLIIVSSVILYYFLHYQLNFNENSIGMRIFLFASLTGVSYMTYSAVKKNKK